MKANIICAVMAALLISSGARAESGRKVTIEAAGSWTVISNGPNSTGGFGPRVTASYGFALSERAHLSFGADFTAWGFGDDARWIGILGGPLARVSGQPWSAPVDLALTLSFPAGRAPICNAWAEHPMCPNFIGVYPAMALGAIYKTERGGGIGASFAAQVFNSSAGVLFGFTPSIVGTFDIAAK